jgi:ssDNA-binding replication factor A large subunit
MSAWEELPIDANKLPLTVKLSGVRVRAWQGIPDITVDTAKQVEFLDTTPWDESINLEDHVVEVELTELTKSSSRVGITTKGTIVSVRDDSGIILRCVECRRVLRDGECASCGSSESQQDVRLRLVIDNGENIVSLLINKAASIKLTGLDEDTMAQKIESEGKMEFVQSLRDMMLGRVVKANGRTIVDEQGAMILADHAELDDDDPGLLATEVRAKWGVN